MPQPPSGGCELKLAWACAAWRPECAQPPSGGCELKLDDAVLELADYAPAAFGRL